MPCHFLDTHGPYQLPTGWHEVTTAQYCKLDSLQLRTMEARASYFAGRPIQVNELVAEALGWMLTPPSAEGGLPYPADLGQETYLQVESIRALLQQQPLHQCFTRVCSIFRERIYQARADYNQVRAERFVGYMEKWPITDTYPAVAHCLAELARLGTKYAALSEPDITEAGRRAQAAGAGRLNVLGHYNVASAYAKDFGIPLEQAYQTSWETVAVWLIQSRLTAEINDTLHQQAKTTNGNGKNH